MLGAEPTCDDAHAVAIQIERRRQAVASGGIEYGWPSCITTPVGVTLVGIRNARSAGATFSGRSRARSSAIRAAGGTPVARDGRVRFASVSHSRSCGSRSARSRNRRCLKNEPLTQPTRFSTLPFSCGRYGQHTSTPMPRSSATPANVAFHSVTTPSRPHLSAIVFGRSKTSSDREVCERKTARRLSAAVERKRRLKTRARTRRSERADWAWRSGSPISMNLSNSSQEPLPLCSSTIAG